MRSDTLLSDRLLVRLNLSVGPIVLGLTLWLAGVASAAGAELRVMCPSALRVPVLELARTFVRSGHKVELVFASVGAIHKRVATGERADVAIGTEQGVDALVRLGRGMEGSQAPIVRSALALAVRKGGAVPSVAAAETVVRIFRDAASIVQPDPQRGVPGGGQVAELFERLGIRDEVRAKTRFVSDVREVAKRVAAGAEEVGVAAMSDLVVATDLAVVGPLIDPATSGVVYAAVVIRGARAADAGRAFIAHLVGPEASTAFRKAGYVPVD